MVGTLPKYIKFHIFTNLTWQELKTCALVSHDWHGLVCGDEFWKYKLQHDYGFIDNTVKVPWRTWYYRVANSGALHTS